MTFKEVEKRLPNGFHDVKIRTIGVDFVDHSVAIGLDLLLGGAGMPDPEEYRAGTLSVAPAYFFFVDPPDPTYKFILSGTAINGYGASVDLGDIEKIDRLRPSLPENTAVYRFFLEELNCSLFIAGGDVELSWDDGRAFI